MIFHSLPSGLLGSTWWYLTISYYVFKSNMSYCLQQEHRKQDDFQIISNYIKISSIEKNVTYFSVNS